MLKKLSVTNLGCFGEAESSINFSEEVLLAGPNNAGKSMFLSAINIFRSSLLVGFNWSNDLYSLNSFKDAVHSHDTSRHIAISMVFLDGDREYSYGMGLSETGSPIFFFDGQASRNSTRAAVDTKLMRGIWFLRPNRSVVPYSMSIGVSASPIQPLKPDGSNVTTFLLERWTDRDPRWAMAESWLRKIDPTMTEMKIPIRGNQTYFETVFGNLPVNVSLQGSGFQSAAAIVAAVVFSPENSTVIIEEPEAFLHPDSQETVVDMINDAVNKQGKQVIFSTHSTNVLKPFYNDVSGQGEKRGESHAKANPAKFSMWTFRKTAAKATISPYDLRNKAWKQFKDDFKQMWG
jgi:hypothetical protein